MDSFNIPSETKTQPGKDATRKINIAMEIDPADMDKGFSELINSFSVEEKQKVFKDVLIEYFNTEQPIKYYKLKNELREVIKEKMKKSGQGGTFFTDYDVEKTSEYITALNEFNKTKEGIFNTIRENVLEYTRNEIYTMIKSDDSVKELTDLIVKTIRDDMKNIILDAIIDNISKGIVLNKETLFNEIRTNFRR